MTKKKKYINSCTFYFYNPKIKFNRKNSKKKKRKIEKGCTKNLNIFQRRIYYPEIRCPKMLKVLKNGNNIKIRLNYEHKRNDISIENSMKKV